MRILIKLLKWIGLMVWDARQLERAVEQVAASFTLGGSHRDGVGLQTGLTSDLREPCSP